MKYKFLPDHLVVIPTILLLSLGSLVIYSSDVKLAIYQLIFGAAGLIIFYLLSFIDFQTYNNYIQYLYYFIIFLLVAVFLLGVESKGSIRWLPLGPIHFQPSEFAKPIFILFLARFWYKRAPSWTNIFKSFLLIVPVLGLIFKQPDLGTVLTLIVIWFMMLVASNISIKKLIVMLLIALMLAPLGWITLKTYQKDRIESFFFPSRDPLGIGYNVLQATISVGSGRLTGEGLGHGTQSKLSFLPEYRTDFIFASMAEEFGFVGSVIVITLFFILVFRILRISIYLNRFGSLISFGVLGLLIFQVLINIGMNIGIMPVTGIPLPFVSYGGSSVISTFICLSFVISAYRFSNQKNNHVLSSY